MLQLTDLFCGAGGSSTGAIQVPGIEVNACANHWQLAVDTHNANHPDARHLCADISQVDPRYFPHSDLLWASPSCTNHSGARGKPRPQGPDLFGDTLPDEAAERSRATMWDVVRFSEHHHYQAVVVENVIEAARWAPFQAWLSAMDSLGYAHHIVYLNSMHAQYAGKGAPQSRDRMYVVFWKRGNTAPNLEPVTAPQAYCAEHGCIRAKQMFKRPERGRWGRYRAQYVYVCPSCYKVVEPHYRPAAEIIDWTDLGTRIGDRSRPLADKTLRRIEAGIDRFWSSTIVEAAGNTYDAADPKHPQYGKPGAYMRAWSTNEPVRTVHTTASKALCVPVEGRDGKEARPSEEPLRTQTTRNETGIAIPCGGTWRTQPASLTEPLATRTTRETDGLAFRTDRRPIELDDVHFRMLTPREIASAMDFPSTYQLLGNKREQVRMAGNAVTPPAARDLITAVAESLHGTP